MNQFIKNILSFHTRLAIKFDLLRLKTRLKNSGKSLTPKADRLHLGCGKRKINGWLNVDITGSDYDIDLAIGQLPWKDNVFDCVVSQHVIEHLHLEHELLPLIKELSRVMKSGGVIWLSTPDLEKVCMAYQNKANTLIEDRKSRFPNFSMNGIPPQHFINDLFHQNGQHKNLFDFEMIKWMLEKDGFKNCERIKEADLLKAMPAFPERKDDLQSVYVKAVLA